MEKESKLGTSDEHAVWPDQKVEVSSSSEEIMVQVFMVVRCYSCKTFQVHQVKKTNKWVCKVCTEKQSVIKIYGKGSGKECRKHVQKLNMVQGERDKREGRGGGSSHPPCDYANTFTAQSAGVKDTQVRHPVVLADTRNNKWTTFIDPPKDDDEDGEDDEHTLADRDKLSYGSKARRKSRRSLSERVPRQKAAEGMVCPYSSVNLQVQSSLDDLLCGVAEKSRPDRYTKLDTPTSNQHTGGHSHSMMDLSTSSPVGATNHKEWMSEIKKDLEQFSQNHGKRGAKQPADMADRSIDEQRIPKVSSRWSQFMCEDDESESEEEIALESSQHNSTTHILGSKSTIAKFTLQTQNLPN